MKPSFSLYVLTIVLLYLIVDHIWMKLKYRKNNYPYKILMGMDEKLKRGDIVTLENFPGYYVIGSVQTIEDPQGGHGKLISLLVPSTINIAFVALLKFLQEK